VARIVADATGKTIVFVTHDADLVAVTGASVIHMDQLARRAA